MGAGHASQDYEVLARVRQRTHAADRFPREQTHSFGDLLRGAGVVEEVAALLGSVVLDMVRDVVE